MVLCFVIAFWQVFIDVKEGVQGKNSEKSSCEVDEVTNLKRRLQ